MAHAMGFKIVRYLTRVSLSQICRFSFLFPFYNLSGGCIDREHSDRIMRTTNYLT